MLILIIKNILKKLILKKIYLIFLDQKYHTIYLIYIIKIFQETYIKEYLKLLFIYIILIQSLFQNHLNIYFQLHLIIYFMVLNLNGSFLNFSF